MKRIVKDINDFVEASEKEAKKNSNAKKRDKNITIKKEVKKNESCL